GLPERAAEDLGLLRIHEDRASADGAVSRDDTVAVDLLRRHVEARATMRDILVQLDERTGIQEELESCPRGLAARCSNAVIRHLSSCFGVGECCDPAFGILRLTGPTRRSFARVELGTWIPWCSLFASGVWHAVLFSRDARSYTAP